MIKSEIEERKTKHVVYADDICGWIEAKNAKGLVG